MTGKRILIVEDEPLIALLLEDILETIGREVAGTVDSVAAALEAIGQGGIDAVILDVNLRGGETSGPVADALAARGIPFVFATGGSADALPEAHRDRPTLPKPFTLQAVEKALDGLG